MQLHLRNAGRCRRDLWARGHLYTVGPGIGSSSAQDQANAHDGALPPQVTDGAHLQPIQPREMPSENKDLIVAMVDALLDRAQDKDIEQALRECVCAHPISWTCCATTLDLFYQHLDEETATLFGVDLSHLRMIVRKLQAPTSWDFLREDPDTLCGPSDLLQHYECWCEGLLATEEPWCPEETVPRPVGKERIILHAFSGRRRIGDYQWFLDIQCSDAEGLLLHVVSLDLVIDEKYGDLSDRQTQEFWLHGITQGWVHGFLGGPPCATWSKARAVHLHAAECGHKRHPRPVRSSTELWGLDALTIRELVQVCDGNNLLGFCLEALVRLAALSRTGILEHPAEPDAEELPSIWKLPVLQLILALPGAQRIKFAQGLLGADSPKPTEMLALNLPTLPKEIVHWRVTPDLPTHRNIGVGKNGEFLTAQLKEYPPALCAALAGSTATAMNSMPVSEAVSVDVAFLEQCKSMVSVDFGSFFGPDHANPKRSV